jgi:F0F1-type ATP synthase membrane subunit b/b'
LRAKLKDEGMHISLYNIQQQLEKTIAQLRSSVPNDEPFGNAHGNWTFPGLNRVDLIEEAQSIIDLIEDEGDEEVGEHEARLTDYVRRLQHLQQQTIPNLWNNAGQAVSAYILTLNSLRKALAPVLTRDGHREAVVKLRKLTAQIRGLEARLNDLQPRTTSITEMVDRIENAYNAADQLPADLESLEEARQKVSEVVQEATKDQGRLLGIREQADQIETHLKESAEEAEAVLLRCETAYSAATSVGLAAAFTERSAVLSTSMWIWVGGLVGALAAGSIFGAGRLQTLVELFKDPNQPVSVIIPNVMLSVLSVGAPIWFAWLSTKQIGQRFKLSEDYAFKASVARAYEGFRREAARIDKNMEARLLASALTRLDELPLRLVETESHGSPWHELANSELVKQALKTAPNFAGQVRELAEKSIAGVRPTKSVRIPASVSAEEQA